MVPVDSQAGLVLQMPCFGSTPIFCKQLTQLMKPKLNIFASNEEEVICSITASS